MKEMYQTTLKEEALESKGEKKTKKEEKAEIVEKPPQIIDYESNTNRDYES